MCDDVSPMAYSKSCLSAIHSIGELATEINVSGDQVCCFSPEPALFLVSVFLLDGVAADPLSFASGLAEAASRSVLAAFVPLDVVSLQNV